MSGELRVNNITDEAGTGSPDFPNGVDAGVLTGTLPAIDGSNLVGVEGVPSGAVMMFAMNTPPTGWLKANGAAISRSTYSDLFDAIGTTFGSGDGSTTFNLPDARGEFLRGWDDGRGVDSGRSFGTTQADAFQGHAHNTDFFINSTSSNTGTIDQRLNRDAGGSNSVIDWSIIDAKETGSFGVPRQANETRPRNIALLACIKF